MEAEPFKYLKAISQQPFLQKGSKSGSERFKVQIPWFPASLFFKKCPQRSRRRHLDRSAALLFQRTAISSSCLAEPTLERHACSVFFKGISAFEPLQQSPL
jgi:hypothetical protein